MVAIGLARAAADHGQLVQQLVGLGLPLLHLDQQLPAHVLGDAVGPGALLAGRDQPLRRGCLGAGRAGAGAADGVALVVLHRRAAVRAPHHALDHAVALDDGGIGAGAELGGGLAEQGEDHVAGVLPGEVLLLSLLQGELHRRFGEVFPVLAAVGVDLVLAHDLHPDAVELILAQAAGEVHVADLVYQVGVEGAVAGLGLALLLLGVGFEILLIVHRGRHGRCKVEGGAAEGGAAIDVRQGASPAGEASLVAQGEIRGKSATFAAQARYSAMDMLIPLLVVLVIVAIVYWVFTQLPLPAPFRWIGVVVIGIVAIALLLDFVPLGHLRLR